MVEIFTKIANRLLAVNYLPKAPSQIFAWILNMSLILVNKEEKSLVSSPCE